MTWDDQGSPLTCIIGSDYDVERSAIDPSVFWGINNSINNDDGKLFLVTGGGYIVGTELDPETYEQKYGEWFDVDSEDWTELARGPKEESEHQWIEAAYIYPNVDTGYYYLFVNWGHCCNGVDSTYEIRVGRSTTPMGPYVDKNGVSLFDGGGILFESSGNGNNWFLIGPGHAGIWTNKKGKDFVSFHYYDGRREGNSWIAEKRLLWDDWGWPYTGKLKQAFPKKMLK